MNLLNLFIINIYSYYSKRRDEGKKIIPWFQTCISIALVTAICVPLILKFAFGKWLSPYDKSESIFMTFFLSLGIIIFFTVKYFYFNKGKHIIGMDEYLKSYTINQRKKSIIISLSILILLPILLCLLIYFQAINII